MKIKRACNPEGPGLRGLITANVVQRRTRPARRGGAGDDQRPAGTRFTSFRWAGTVRRRDCRYALQLYADAPDIQPIAIKNVRANQRCPPPTPRPGRRLPVTHVQRHAARRGSCSASSASAAAAGSRAPRAASNYLRTYKAEVGIADILAPAVAIIGDTPLARGEWVRGTQPLNYDASDNVGVRMAQALVSGQTGGSQQRPCAFASPERAFAERVPCPNGPGQIDVDTTIFPEGTQALVVQAQDTAGNIGDSARGDGADRQHAARPGRGRASRADRRGATATTSRSRGRTRPRSIARRSLAAGYKLCGGRRLGRCSRGEQAGADLSRFGVQVPAPGEWTLVAVATRRRGQRDRERRVGAGDAALRPRTAAARLRSAIGRRPDTRVGPGDRQGLRAGGRRDRDQPRPARAPGRRSRRRRTAAGCVARIDDGALPAGATCCGRPRHDQAHNEASTDRRLDGQPMMLTLPLRIVSIDAGRRSSVSAWSGGRSADTASADMSAAG